MSGRERRPKKRGARHPRHQAQQVQDSRGTSAQDHSRESTQNTLHVPGETPTGGGYDEVDGLLQSCVTSSSGYVSQSSGASSISRPHESQDSGMNELSLVPDSLEVTPNRPYLSESRLGVSGDTSHHVLSSLPTHPDQIPVHGVVYQETSSAVGSSKILTSAARQPTPIYDIRIQRTPTNQHRPEQHDDRPLEAGASATFNPRPPLDFRNAAYPQLVTRQSRMVSFANWRSDHTHRPEDFVDVGLFFAGYADCVRCFYCGLGLKYWRADDIPAYQHARYRPTCVYMIMCMGQSYVDRVQEDVQSQQANQTAAQSSTQAIESTTTCQGTAAPTEDPTPMRSEAALAAMRQGWSREEVSRAVKKVIEMGQNCLTEDILLDVLSNLNAESTRLQSELQHDLDTEDDESDVSTNFDEIDHGAIGVSHHRTGSVQASASAETNEVSDIQPCSSTEQAARVELDLQEEMRVVEREHTYLKARTTCHVCHQRPVNSLYMPCGHVIACEPCADDATRCKLCGKVILGTANIYFA